MTDALWIDQVPALLEEAATEYSGDAQLLRWDFHQDARVWEIAAEELQAAAARIRERTAGLPDTQRHDTDADDVKALRSNAPAGTRMAGRSLLRLIRK